MISLRPMLTTLALTVLLFVWSGVAQALPWGVPATPQYDASGRPPDAFQSPHTVRAEPGTWTTPAFDSELGGSMLTLTTERSFAWIVSSPIEHYDPARYLAVELMSQLLVALVIVAVTLLTRELPARRRAGVVAILALGASIATYGQLMNWWGMPAWYAVGVSVNLIVGWTLSAALAGRLLAARA